MSSNCKLGSHKKSNIVGCTVDARGLINHPVTVCKSPKGYSKKSAKLLL